MGYRKSTPLNIVSAESKNLSLEFRYELLAYKYVLRSLSMENNPVINSLKNLLEKSNNPTLDFNYQKSFILECYENSWFYCGLIDSSPVYYLYQYSHQSRFYTPNIDFKTGEKLQNSPRANDQFMDMFIGTKNKDFINIFTDGSKIRADDHS
uniref:Uncharacterized protein n=1 Tax=Trichogramma kaykai TaxID=54128 RepID=A0ABD2X9K0_9HYME